MKKQTFDTQQLELLKQILELQKSILELIRGMQYSIFIHSQPQPLPYPYGGTWVNPNPICPNGTSTITLNNEASYVTASV